ncbi:enoyl-CoA hydratase/isomerase family protein [Ottowia thiooxydans]|uniref:enoyl-CoA hydratase/isomerase family protein n=1 Tax=Ottowia thiooxydans TaxID=219182 RepID=UPI00040389FA|nr:enoyl-CoA hydratase/isomerase family protein [Ottowia thiooxydans]
MQVEFFSGEFISVQQDGRVALVRFLRESKKNALSSALLNELDLVARKLRVNPQVSVAVLTGGDTCFSAGADLKDPCVFTSASAFEYRLGLVLRTEIARAWAELPQITIAAIEGFAIGGGLSIALCCDFRVMADNAFISVPEVDMDSIYAWNTIPRLNSAIGPQYTKRLVILGEKISADTALQWGLVDFVHTAEQVTSHALGLAQAIAAKSKLALQISKRNINALQSAHTHLLAHADVDQAALCRLEKTQQA